ncbi:GNAT family N-acetyltransferase [Neobacillus drentensis]|uniref:GNAT family N-acetyltransferase n=1 Tax=Neobacillus drentensis TaxID=220684 RepID=UPI003B58B163
MNIVHTTKLEKSKITHFFSNHWGSPQMVISSGIFQCDELDGFAALNDNGDIIGLITTVISGDECEIISLDSIEENKGIGTRLIQQLERTAREQDCRRVKLVTTNDNLHALQFYQKRGYRLVHIYPNAVEEARRIKPEISLFAENGIPICDEILLEKSLD